MSTQDTAGIGTEWLLLKWGTLKGWHINTDRSKAALETYYSFGVCESVMFQQDSVEQKAALCELIDAIDGLVKSEWHGEMSKDEAKRYVTEYRS